MRVTTLFFGRVLCSYSFSVFLLLRVSARGTQDAIMGLEVQGLESMDAGTYTRIRTMIKNRQGLNGGLYVPNNAFHTLV